MSDIPDPDQALEALEIDLEVAEIGEILEAHGVPPEVELAAALWEWMERKRTAAG